MTDLSLHICVIFAHFDIQTYLGYWHIRAASHGSGSGKVTILSPTHQTQHVLSFGTVAVTCIHT